MPAIGSTAAIDAVLTTWPSSPDARMSGTKARTPWMTPHRSTSITRCHSSSGISQHGPPFTMPALFMATCSAPNRSSAARPTASTASGSRTSATTACTTAPAASSRSACWCSAASSTSAITTWAPSAVAASTTARPIPLAAPVTTIVFPPSSMGRA